MQSDANALKPAGFTVFMLCTVRYDRLEVLRSGNKADTAGRYTMRSAAGMLPTLSRTHLHDRVMEVARMPDAPNQPIALPLDRAVLAELN
jgi:hypothetical protein